MVNIPPISSGVWSKLVTSSSSLALNSFATKMLLSRIVSKEKKAAQFSKESYELISDFFTKNHDIPNIVKDLDLIKAL